MNYFKPTEDEVALMRDMRLKAATCIREGKTSISLSTVEYNTAFLFEEMQLINMNNGQPLTSVYYGLRMDHETSKAN